MQPLKKSITGSTEEETAENDQSAVDLADSTTRLPVEAALQGKPKRCGLVDLIYFPLSFYV